MSTMLKQCPTYDRVAYPAKLDDSRRKINNRLKTARGHLDGIIRMVEDDTWCPDIMKQLAAVQGMFEATSREVFRNIWKATLPMPSEPDVAMRLSTNSGKR
ncbi:MAG: metal-sensing transcriptional repressor [Nitriliruptoraceae bacterium]